VPCFQLLLGKVKEEGVERKTTFGILEQLIHEQRKLISLQKLGTCAVDLEAHKINERLRWYPLIQFLCFKQMKTVKFTGKSRKMSTQHYTFWEIRLF
jgi:hypothetical protein